MKKIIISLCIALCVAHVAYAQRDDTDIDIVQSLFGRSKRLIINEYIQPDDKEKNLSGTYTMNMKRKEKQSRNRV